MTLRIENNNYSETPPQSCGVKRLFDDESLVRIYLTLNLKFLAKQINWTFWGKKIQEVGQPF